jgi:hypothetical protein
LVSGEFPDLTLTSAGLISGTPGAAGTLACTEGFVLFLAARLVGPR